MIYKHYAIRELTNIYHLFDKDTTIYSIMQIFI